MGLLPVTIGAQGLWVSKLALRRLPGKMAFPDFIHISLGYDVKKGLQCDQIYYGVKYTKLAAVDLNKKNFVKVPYWK